MSTSLILSGSYYLRCGLPLKTTAGAGASGQVYNGDAAGNQGGGGQPDCQRCSSHPFQQERRPEAAQDEDVDKYKDGAGAGNGGHQ